MRWFTSDPHFDHKNVIKYCGRPYATVEEMNEDIIGRHNEVVKPDDEVYHLGDFSMSGRAVPIYLPRMNGIHHLRAGNHDAVHPASHKNKPLKRTNAFNTYLDAGFQSVCLTEHIVINGTKVLLCHLPYRKGEPGDHGEKYMDYRPVDEGEWLLHGHVHQVWKQKGRMINVGVDVWNFYPVSELEIANMIAEGEKNVGLLFDSGGGVLLGSGTRPPENL